MVEVSPKPRLKLPKDATDVVEALLAKGVMGGVPAGRLFPDRADLADHLIVAATETNSDEDIAAFATALQEVLS